MHDLLPQLPPARRRLSHGRRALSPATTAVSRRTAAARRPRVAANAGCRSRSAATCASTSTAPIRVGSPFAPRPPRGRSAAPARGVGPVDVLGRCSRASWTSTSAAGIPGLLAGLPQGAPTGSSWLSAAPPGSAQVPPWCDHGARSWSSTRPSDRPPTSPRPALCGTAAARGAVDRPQWRRPHRHATQPLPSPYPCTPRYARGRRATRATRATACHPGGRAAR